MCVCVCVEWKLGVVGWGCGGEKGVMNVVTNILG